MEAVTSAATQGALVVVVDDCSPDEYREEFRSIAKLGLGSQVVFLQHRTNRGPSAARNTAIRWVLQHAPTVEFIVPLDADDLLALGAIEHLEAALDRIDDDQVGWIGGDGTLFGTYEGAARMPRRFSRYRLSQENMFFVTSCIRRAIFEQGIWYDEDLHGFEDWGFYLRALDRGWVGQHIGEFGFHYRKHGPSRLAENRPYFESFREHIREQLPALYGRQAELRLEHEDLPRFAVVDLDSGVVEYLSSPDLPPKVVTPGTDEFEAYRPPIVIAARSGWLQQLRAERTWHQTLSLSQMSMRHQPALALGWHRAQHENVRGLEFRSSALPPAGYVLSAAVVGHDLELLLATLEGNHEPPDTLQLGPAVQTMPPPPSNVHPAAVEALTALMVPSAQVRQQWPDDEIASGDREWAFWHSVRQLRRTEVRATPNGIRDVGIVVPWIGLGGMDIIMLEFALALANRPGYRVHLLTTLAGISEMNPSYLSAFSTINPVPDTPGADLTARALMAQMDVLLIANSEAALNFIGTLPSESRPTTLVFIQNVDVSRDGTLVGFLFPMARQYEQFIDAYVVPSLLSADMLASFGVPAHKRIVVPNAAAYRPDPRSPSHQLAGGHLPSEDRPMRLLFAGRFDRQKGMDRLVTIIETLRERGVKFELRLVGRALLESDDIPRGDGITLLPPSFDPDEMAAHFSWADCLLLPSRWEGFPLVMLDAMAFGLLVVTSDVGGTPEYVTDGNECVLVEDKLGDDHVIARFLEALTAFDREPSAFDDIRRRGQQFSATLTWPDLADRIEALFGANERN